MRGGGAPAPGRPRRHRLRAVRVRPGEPGRGILMHTTAWQDMTERGLLDETVPACRARYSRLVTRAAGTGRERWLGDVQFDTVLFNWAHLYQSLRRRVPDSLYRGGAAVER